MTQPREEIRSALATVRQLIARLERGCPALELEVLRLVVEGLEVGLRDYGALDADDERDWLLEALYEIRDALVYIGMAIVRAMRRRG